MTNPTTDETAYTCATCGATFRLQATAEPRCPSCLRSSGLVQQDPTSATSDSPSWGTSQTLVAIALALAAVGLAYVLGVMGPAPLEPSAETDKATSQSVNAMASVPEALKLTPFAVDGAVRLAVEPLPRDATGILAAVRSAQADGNLPARDVDGAMDGAPRSAGDLAGGLMGKRAPESGSLEQAMLLGALLDARSLGPITYGVDDAAPDAATDIIRRRYLVRPAEGAWLALDDQPVPEAPRALSEAGLLANILAWRALGDLSSEDMDAASKASQTARSLASKDAAILFVAGQVQVLGGLAEPGLATMERAAGIQADSRTWFALGVMSAEANQPFKARQYLLKATQDGKSAEAHLLLAQLSLERLPTTPKDGHGALIEEARTHVQHAEATDAKAPGLTTMKAQLAALGGDIEGAEDLLRAETAAKPTDTEAWLALFQFLLEIEREREAVETLMSGIEAGAEGGTLHQVLGMILGQQGETAQAISALKTALEREPELRAGIRLQLAQLVRHDGDEAGAIALLQEEIALEGGEKREARLLLAQLHLDAGRPGAARPLVDAVIADGPDDQDALMVAYLVALKSGQPGTEEKKAALKVIGQRSAVGRVLLEQGFIEEGERVLREAVIEDKGDQLAPVLLGALLLGTGRGDEANQLKDEVLANTPAGEQRDGLRQLFEVAFAQATKEVEARPHVPEVPPVETP